MRIFKCKSSCCIDRVDHEAEELKDIAKNLMQCFERISRELEKLKAKIMVVERRLNMLHTMV